MDQGTASVWLNGRTGHFRNFLSKRVIDKAIGKLESYDPLEKTKITDWMD